MKSIQIGSIGFGAVRFFCEDADLRIIMCIDCLFVSKMEQVENCLMFHLILHVSCAEIVFNSKYYKFIFS